MNGFDAMDKRDGTQYNPIGEAIQTYYSPLTDEYVFYIDDRTSATSSYSFYEYDTPYTSGFDKIDGVKRLMATKRRSMHYFAPPTAVNGQINLYQTDYRNVVCKTISSGPDFSSAAWFAPEYRVIDSAVGYPFYISRATRDDYTETSSKEHLGLSSVAWKVTSGNSSEYWKILTATNYQTVPGDYTSAISGATAFHDTGLSGFYGTYVVPSGGYINAWAVPRSNMISACNVSDGALDYDVSLISRLGNNTSAIVNTKNSSDNTPLSVLLPKPIAYSVYADAFDFKLRYTSSQLISPNACLPYFRLVDSDIFDISCPDGASGVSNYDGNVKYYYAVDASLKDSYFALSGTYNIGNIIASGLIDTGDYNPVNGKYPSAIRDFSSAFGLDLTEGFTFYNRKKLAVYPSSCVILDYEPIECYRNGIPVPSNRLMYYQILLSGFDTVNNNDVYIVPSGIFDLGELSASNDDWGDYHIYVEGENGRYEENVFHSVNKSNEGFNLCGSGRIGIEFAMSNAEVESRTIMVDPRFANDSFTVSAGTSIKEISKVDISVSEPSDALNSIISYTVGNVEIECKSGASYLTVKCSMKDGNDIAYSTDDISNLRCINGTFSSIADGYVNIFCHNVSGDTFRFGIENTLPKQLKIKIYEISATDGRNRTSDFTAGTDYAADDVTLRGLSTLDSAVVKTSREYSNDGKIYGDLTASGGWSVKKLGNGTSAPGSYAGINITSGWFGDESVAIGKSKVMYLSGYNSGMRYVSLITAVHVPEVERSIFDQDVSLSAFPEYACRYENNGKTCTWYKNGYSVDSNGKYDFGNQYQYGPYVMSDGSHVENVYFRAYLSNDFANYRAESTLALTDGGNTISCGTQVGDGTGAIQYAYVAPKSVGRRSRVDYSAELSFDLIRPDNSRVFGGLPDAVTAYEGRKKILAPRTSKLAGVKFISGIDDIKSGIQNVFGAGVSYIPVGDIVGNQTGDALDDLIYFPVGGYVGTSTVLDNRIKPDGDVIDIYESPMTATEGLSAGHLFPGNQVGLFHTQVAVNPPAAQRSDYEVEYHMAMRPLSAAFDGFSEDSRVNYWVDNKYTRNTPILAELYPTYYEDEKYGVVRNTSSILCVSAVKNCMVGIVADIDSQHSFDGRSYYCADWNQAGVEMRGSAEHVLWAPPKIKFITPVIIANRDEEGWVPWYNESQVSSFDYFYAQGTNTDVATRMEIDEPIYRMSGFEDAGYYGIGASGFISACEKDKNVDGVYRVKQIVETYHSDEDLWVETFGVWSSAVLRTPLSQKISLDYTMTDLTIGPNEMITNDVLNRRFEMLQHDLEQVESISRYYKNPPTRYVGYVGYGDEVVITYDYSMKTDISINNHYGFWGTGPNDDKNRLDWQWCWSSEGEFVCPSAYNSTWSSAFKPTIVYGANDVFVDDNTMNVYVTSGSTFSLGGMSTYTQNYDVEDDRPKFRDYSEVNGTAPKLTSIRVMDDGTVVILAPEFNRVLIYSKFDADNPKSETDLVFKYDFGGLGGANANLRFNNPVDIAIDNGCNSKWGQLIYVLDAGNSCVKVYNISGAFIAKIDYSVRAWAHEEAISLAVSERGTISILTKYRVMFYNINGEYEGEFALERNDPIQICANKTANFLYVLYDDDVLKISATGLLIGNFSVSDKWHRLDSYMVKGIPPYYGKFRRMSVTKFNQVYLVMDNITLIYADLLTEMSLAAQNYRDIQWSLDQIKIGRNEYMQDFVINIALHRMYDNINLFRKSLYGTLRVYEKNGIKYLRTNNLSEGEYALTNEVPSKGEIFIPSNAPVSARIFNDNIEKLYGIIVKLLEWCQTSL